MPVIEPAIRPPAEAESFLLQVTLGCSANRCTFCGAYRGKPFRIKAAAEISADIQRAAMLAPDTRRVFLMDGDALAVPNPRLLPVLQELQRSFPRLARISSYANGYNINSRSAAELRELSANRLSLIYLGLESGSQLVLERCRKGSGVADMIRAVRDAAQAGIKSSVMVLLGLGGRKYSRLHVAETVRALNEMQPRYLSFLAVMLLPGTPLFDEAARGEFTALSARETLEEMCGLIAGLELRQTIFRSDHASNFLPLEGRFPADKERLLRTVAAALNGALALKPDDLRDL